jgi:hypothetical protein
MHVSLNLNLKMAKKIFINNLNTFVSKQLLAELRNDQPNEEGEVNAEANIIFGSYVDKDSSEKPNGVKKMLKVSAAGFTFGRGPSPDWP